MERGLSTAPAPVCFPLFGAFCAGVGSTKSKSSLFCDISMSSMTTLSSHAQASPFNAPCKRNSKFLLSLYAFKAVPSRPAFLSNLQMLASRSVRTNAGFVFSRPFSTSRVHTLVVTASSDGGARLCGGEAVELEVPRTLLSRLLEAISNGTVPGRSAPAAVRTVAPVCSPETKSSSMSARSEIVLSRCTWAVLPVTPSRCCSKLCRSRKPTRASPST
mmetsp:Transcript_69760/g.134571  ORF Transcript_69760/g.134571 Transcript_69760/m.134571 type:complete len:217 (+) Transcript_69760:692-1342(+)